jgi:hypothetical protein
LNLLLKFSLESSDFEKVVLEGVDFHFMSQLLDSGRKKQERSELKTGNLYFNRHFPD